MNNTPLQHALRELRRLFTSRQALAILSGVVILLGLSGPFDTATSLRFGPRLAYWAVTAPLTFGAGVFTSALFSEILRARLPAWGLIASVSAITALAVTAIVVLLNWFAFGTNPVEVANLSGLLLSVLLTAAVISVLVFLFGDMANPPQTADHAPPPLLDRLDFGKRGALISLTVQDHYVEVVTTKGTSLLLMRLADAIRETGDVAGLQVHRSHWVALNQIKDARRTGDRAILCMSDNREIPASRSNIPALKDAGILPR